MDNCSEKSQVQKICPYRTSLLERLSVPIYMYNTTTTPPGESCPLRLEASVGYRWIRLDPQGPKMGGASRISGPDQRGRRRQVPGGPEPGHPQGLIFWKSC